MGKGGSCAGTGCMTIIGGITVWLAIGAAFHSLKGCGHVTGNPEVDLIDKAQETYEKVTDERKFEAEAVPTGSFKIDFHSQKSSDKRFEFDVRGRDENGTLKVNVRELGRKESDLGQNARFNVVFWDAAEPEKKGMAFQVNLNRLGGVTVHPFADNLQTVIISGGELVCGRFKGNSIQFVPEPAPRLDRVRTLNRTELTLPERLMRIDSYSVSMHNKTNVPLIIRPRVAQSERGSR